MSVKTIQQTFYTSNTSTHCSCALHNHHHPERRYLRPITISSVRTRHGEVTVIYISLSSSRACSLQYPSYLANCFKVLRLAIRAVSQIVYLLQFNSSSNLQDMHRHSFTALNSTFIVDSEYQFVKELGQGAYGCVVAAKHRRSGEGCAIKKITNINTKVSFSTVIIAISSIPAAYIYADMLLRHV